MPSLSVRSLCQAVCLPVCKYWGSSIWPNTISAHPSVVVTRKVSLQHSRYTSLQLSRHTLPAVSPAQIQYMTFVACRRLAFLSLSSAECRYKTCGDFQRCGQASGILCREIEIGHQIALKKQAIECDRLQKFCQCPPQQQFEMKGFEGFLADAVRMTLKM